MPDTVFKKEFNRKIVRESEIILITVPDDQIKLVINRLDLPGVKWHNKLVIHMSGSLSSLELKKLKTKGAVTGSIHPAQTFGDCFLPKSIFNGIYLAVEGDNQVIKFGKKIAALLHTKIILLKAEDKVLYHIAAVAASNFFVALLDYVNQLYSQLGLNENKKLILPIVNQTLINFSNNRTKDILTGPLQRGDFKTIKSHVNYLKENQKALFPVYAEISKYISRFMIKENKSKKKLNRILLNG